MNSGILDASINEKWQRAHVLVEQLHNAEPKLVPNAALDSMEYSGLRHLRRQARATHAQLVGFEAAGAHAQFEKANETKLHLPGVSKEPPLHRGFKPLIDSLERSPFIKDAGKAVMHARPKNFGIGNRMWQRTLDMVNGSTVYCMKNPRRAIAIALASLVGKLLFVYFCWEAVKRTADAVLGIHTKKKSETPPPVQIVVAPPAQTLQPSSSAPTMIPQSLTAAAVAQSSSRAG